MLEAAGVDVASHLWISNRAQVLLPFHRLMEKMSEARPERISIGTTSRGIGPCYEDKIGRRGIRMADLLDPDIFRALYDALAEEKDRHRQGASTSTKTMDIDAGSRRVRALRRAHPPDGVRYRRAAQRGDRGRASA